MVKPRGMSVIDRTGHKIGRLTVITRGPNQVFDTYVVTNWLCECECGNRIMVRGHSLAKAARGKGGTQSCGCFLRDSVAKRSTKHGKQSSRVYKIWQMMLQRCENPKHTGFSYYGGRGIQVCDRWHDFNNFLADMGEPPPRYTLDRIDVNGNYEPSNCKWASRREQSNNRRNNTLITFDGETHTIANWARLKNLTKGALITRISNKWPLEKALNTPLRKPK